VGRAGCERDIDVPVVPAIPLGGFADSRASGVGRCGVVGLGPFMGVELGLDFKLLKGEDRNPRQDLARLN
jgi:hypothetical protein